MITAIARFISFISNPLFVLVPVPFMLVYKTSNDFGYALRWSFYSFAFLFIVVAFVVYGVKRGIFTDLDVSKREQRPLLFTVTVILALLYTLGLYVFHGPFILLITIFGILTGVFISSAVNTKIKASMHVATISAVTSALGIGYSGKYWLLLAIIPVIGWARVQIKRHTVSETIVGAALGCLLSVSMFLLTRTLLH